MRNKVLGLLGLFAMSLLFTGCENVRSYSLRSYQGPLPMNDYRHINPESYGVPMEPR